MEQESDGNLVKITDICRACLTRTENMKYLLENSEDIFLLVSKFACVANLEVELGIKYPSYLCTICEEKIISSYEFQQQCQKSNHLVNEFLAVSENQETLQFEPGSELISKNWKSSEDVNPAEVLQNSTGTTEPHIKEIINPVITSTLTSTSNNHDTGKYNEQFQEELRTIILDLKHKYMSDNVCVFCEFQAANRQTLSAHISRVHKKSMNFWCSICNKVFSSSEAHSWEAHRDDLMCKFCQIQFTTFNAAIEHLYSHQVLGENCLVKSEKAVQKKESTCDVYTESFDSPELVNIHAEKYLFSCKFCNKTFSTKKVLRNHKCNKARRKKNNDLTKGIKKDNSILQIKDTEGKETSIDTTGLPEKFKNFTPKELPFQNKAMQRMRLTQYSIEDVEKAISIVREKMYSHVDCIFCHFTATTNRSLSVHVTRVHSEYKGKWCSSCNQVIENQTNHNKEVHYEDLKCPFCRKVKANMGHFMEHLASHSGERLHKCDICQKSFIAPRLLRMHKEKHAKERPFKCEICKKVFLQAKHLKSHIKIHQSSEENFIKFESTEDNIVKNEIENDDKGNSGCKSDNTVKAEETPERPHNFCIDCNKKVRSLPSHYSKHHDKTNPANNEKPNLCPHCGKIFKTISKLKVHMRTHTGERPYKCQYCDKRVKTRSVLIVHQRTHTGEKPYMCTVCGKSFAQVSMLNTHTRIHTGRPEKCTICEKRFCRPAELRLHMRIHTGEKPYVCEQCGQAFKQRSHLVEHMRTHNDNRPFKCQYCDKAFKRSMTLQSHVQIHTGQKPFKCSQCSYACRQPYSLTQHMIQHENDKPQSDYRHKCQVCERTYATSAHLTAHQNRIHSGVTIKSMENTLQPPTNNEIIASAVHVDQDADQNDQNDYQVSQDNQLESPDQIETVESVENFSAVIIQSANDEDNVKFEPIEIQFTPLPDS